MRVSNSQLRTICVSRSSLVLEKNVIQLATNHPTYESRAVALFTNDLLASLGLRTQMSCLELFALQSILERSPMHRDNTVVMIHLIWVTLVRGQATLIGISGACHTGTHMAHQMLNNHKY